MKIETYGDTSISDDATVGFEYADDVAPTVLHEPAVVRAGSIIYCDVVAGAQFATGHNALIREQTTVGENVLVGTNAVIEGQTDIGSHVSLQTGVFVPTQTTIGDNVFIGPNAVLTNDRHPVRTDEELAGPDIADGVSIGANATILPDVSIGERSFVAAGSVVVEDVPPETLAVGVPACHRNLPDKLQTPNTIDS